MERTQIYISKAQASALDKAARDRGTTRSHLIREAIEERYGTHPDRDQIRQVLQATAGLWRDRKETGAEYVERLRSGSRRRALESYRNRPDAE